MTFRRVTIALGAVFSLFTLAVAILLIFTSVWDIVLRRYVGIDRLLDIESAAIFGCLVVPVATAILVARRPNGAAALYVLAALLWLVGFFATDTFYRIPNILALIAVMPLPSLVLAAMSYVNGRRPSA